MYLFVIFCTDLESIFQNQWLDDDAWMAQWRVVTWRFFNVFFFFGGVGGYIIIIESGTDGKTTALFGSERDKRERERDRIKEAAVGAWESNSVLMG